MEMRPPISIADLLRAFGELDPKNDAEKRAIAAMLGFDWQASAATPQQAAQSKGEAQRKRADEEGDQRKTRPPERREPPQRRDDARRQAGGGLAISGPQPVPRAPLDLTGPVLQPGRLGRAPAPAPLFRPQWTRAILAASLSARKPIGPPDLERAVERIARGEALKVLPRQPILTLARGVQALIDVGDNMQPFWQDRAVLRRDLRRIVGSGSLDMLQCAGSPRKTRRSDRARAWQDYETRFPPQFDACVLIVSDFGIGKGLGFASGASPYAWARLARRLKRAGHRVVGFVPYPPARWPAELSRAIDLVPWDRATTVGRISLARARRAAS